MHAILEVSISYSSKIIAKVNVDNKQTGHSFYMPPIHQCRGIKRKIQHTVDVECLPVDCLVMSPTHSSMNPAGLPCLLHTALCPGDINEIRPFSNMLKIMCLENLKKSIF